MRLESKTYKQINGDIEWRIVSKQKEFVSNIGSWGDAPGWSEQKYQAEILKLSLNNTLFLIEDSYSMMGESSNWKDLFIFSKNTWKNTGIILTTRSCCNGSEHDYSYKGKISVIASEKEYPDLLLTKTGTNFDSEKNKFIPVENEIYVFNGKEYQLKNELQEKQAIKQPEQNQLVAQTNQQQTLSENKKWTRDFGNGIISTIVSEPCQIPEFTNQGYTYSISSSIPIARLKRKDDAWQISGNTATTVLGCWFKNNELIHAKLRRKKDGKTWEQDFKLDDGNWVSE